MSTKAKRKQPATIKITPRLIIPPIQVSVHSKEHGDDGAGHYGDVLIEKPVFVGNRLGRFEVANKLRELAEVIAGTEYGEGDIAGADVFVLLRRSRS